MKEEWREITEFPDYAISNHGRVKRLTRGTSQAAISKIKRGEGWAHVQ